MALVTTKEMFQKAYEGKYAIGAFNVDTVDILKGVLEGAKRANSPVIVAVSGRMLNDVPYLRQAVIAAANEYTIPIALHLDHGKSVELCKQCVDDGFTSVMIDASGYDLETNIAKTHEVVQYAHSRGVVVEAELGAIAGKEDDLVVESNMFTKPDDAVEFVTRTGIDSLAIAIGTAHGAYKFKPNQKPQLRLDILEEIAARLPRFPLVLHGASSIPQERLDIFNQYGGKMPAAIGIPEDMLRKATAKGICKINVASDVRICYFGELRRQFALHPDTHDAKTFLQPALNAVADLVYDRLVNVMGSAGKA